MKKLYLVSVSGGKDSTVTMHYMLNKYPRNQLKFIFADTGWENPLTYKYIDYLDKTYKLDLIRVSSEKFKDMETLCVSKKMFPNRVNKFCTNELKIIPILNKINEFKLLGFKVISVVGVRKEESEKRKGEGLWKTNFTHHANFISFRSLKNIKKSKSVKNFYSNENAVTIYQPIVNWTTQEVYDYSKKNNIELNPLYKMGCSRVGCYPCINSSKNEIGMLSFEAVQKVKALENKVSKVTTNSKNATFFYSKGKPIPIEDIYKKNEFNSLGLDLGCINPYGLCE
ncbi:MAG: phosphoadenosine phosphosulfate reductase family protein [Candidatus Gastranaerophilales bacterium]|nr:phosphoadenosine phosphosulfate reductase family protein [Candidatus Gastranaerophilales bacterium]